ncbi:MAG: hypothetical protein WAO20_16090 [Acidobacteriota bacterium]
MMRRLMCAGVVVIFLLLAANGQEKEQQKGKQKTESYTAMAVGVRGAAAASSTSLNFRVNEYTSDEQAEEFLELLVEGGLDHLRRALEKVKVGTVAPAGRLGTDIAVARRRQTEAGTLLTFVTARNMPFFELYRSGRSTNYPFGVFQLLVDEEGKGEGSAIAAARVFFDKEDRLVIESYGHMDTIRLVNVRRY